MINKTKNSIFYGWWVLLALLAIEMIAPMGRYSVTAFFPFLSSELRWSRSLIGSAQTMALWVYATLVPLSGWMVDRIGSRKTLFLGGFLSLGAWGLLSTIRAPWQLYCYYGLIMALAVSMCHMVPIQAAANKWFRKRAGLVTGFTSAAFGLGVSIFIPLVTNMAGSIGWRTTSMIYGITAGIVIMILAFSVIRDTPESIGLEPYSETSTQVSENNATTKESVSTGDAIKTSPFWLLFVAYGLLGIPLQGVLAHLIVWGVDIGASKAGAGVLITAMFLPSIASKIGGGLVGDILGKKRIIIVSQISCLLIMLWAWQSVHTSKTLMIFAMLMGLGYGLSMGLFTPYLADLFGRANVGALFGILTLGHGLIGGCGPLIWGLIFDTFGKYNLACLISAACYGAAATAVFPISSTLTRSQN
jgi:MFS family permease